METMEYESFEKCWKQFAIQLQGKMMIEAKKGVVTTASFNLILASIIDFWDSRYCEGGRWLDNYEKKYPKKAELIRSILLEDMKFKEEAKGLSNNDFLKYVVPVGSAAAGFVVSKIIGTSSMVQTVCTIAPAVVAYPVTTNLLDNITSSNKKELIQIYMNQLEKYKLSIESILKDI